MLTSSPTSISSSVFFQAPVDELATSQSAASSSAVSAPSIAEVKKPPNCSPSTGKAA